MPVPDLEVAEILSRNLGCKVQVIKPTPPEKRKPFALSLDWDGVAANRPGFQLGAMARWAFTPWRYNNPLNPGQPISAEERAIREVQLTKAEARDLMRLQGRTVNQRLLNEIGMLDSDQAIFINTGRSNNRQIVDFTLAQAANIGLTSYLIDGAFFKPPGRTSIESKYWALKEIENRGFTFDHWDDDAYTIKQLAPHFPGSFFQTIPDWSTLFLLTRGARARHNSSSGYYNIGEIEFRFDLGPYTIRIW